MVLNYLLYAVPVQDSYTLGGWTHKQNHIPELGKTAGAVRILFDEYCNNMDLDCPPQNIVGGKTAFKDNWYTSQELLDSLYSINVSLCGTIRRSRIDRSVLSLLEEETGDVYVNVDECHATLLKMIAETRNGPKSVYFLTSNPFLRRECRNTVNISRQIAADNPLAQQSILVNGGATVAAHKMAVSYSYNMGESDLADMKIHQSTSLIKVKKWWPAVFFFLLNGILHNSHVLYCKIKNQDRNIPFKDFKEAVARGLISNQTFVKYSRRPRQYFLLI